jgi:pimeloyl-ACP methyl ester carboxylesterase
VGRIEERMIAVRAMDGLSLSGMEIMPAGRQAAACVVWAHGFGVGYDLPQCVRLGRELARRNIAFVAGNLRGHAGGVTGWRYRGERTDHVRIGSWWEVFEESALDIAAWIEHGQLLGAPNLVLAGHSFGALRSVFYLSHARDRRIGGLVLASLSFGLRKLNEATAALAVDMVAEGRGEDLLPEGSWPSGFGTRTVSAQTYASWWRVAPGLFNPSAGWFGDLECPILMWYGSASDVGGDSELDYLTTLAGSGSRVERRILDGVTHSYDGGEATMAEAMAEWVASLHPTAVPNNQGLGAKE